MADDGEAAEVRQIWSALGLPGVIDVHTHFMPKSVVDKVWRYFDSAGPLSAAAGRSTIQAATREQRFFLSAFRQGPAVEQLPGLLQRCQAPKSRSP